MMPLLSRYACTFRDSFIILNDYVSLEYENSGSEYIVQGAKTLFFGMQVMML